MAGPDLIDQVVDDVSKFQFKGKKLFRTVESGSGDVDDENHHKDSPHCMVRYVDKSSDDEEPQLGTRDIVLKIYIRDHEGGPDGTKQQSSSGTRGFYSQISQYLNDNYAYKAGGVYERAMYLDNISSQTPEGEGLWSFVVTYKVLLG